MRENFTSGSMMDGWERIVREGWRGAKGSPRSSGTLVDLVEAAEEWRGTIVP